MDLIAVEVPKGARLAKSDCRALAFGLGNGQNKLSARLVCTDPLDYVGQVVVCSWQVTNEGKGGRLRIRLTPVKEQPTHTFEACARSNTFVVRLIKG